MISPEEESAILTFLCNINDWKIEFGQGMAFIDEQEKKIHINPEQQELRQLVSLGLAHCREIREWKDEVNLARDIEYSFKNDMFDFLPENILGYYFSI